METLKFEIKQTIKATKEQVWTILTNNDEVKKWFPEMSYHEEGELGYYRWFDGNMELKLSVLQKKEKQLMSFEWAKNEVLFELIAKQDETELRFYEILNEIIDHTFMDLAGWYVCIEKIRRIAEKNEEAVSEDLWKIKYEEYKKLFEVK
ncbi:SRPBCC domain-containing protein [Rummeliibacillus sp. JY-2-4R]